eukprot:CAMPEP_0117656226 /NCGR_PEP_ID=MMETSP0804-20121206/4693_1 /TAXON_ID=1074897 /ORGANISM="Tetraselmis astigmatica, Strain CCMP880" /LENGTH=114 /DNA_ID=CAMNT_0005462617 /DNA_START=191 /DNA_END=535 /DNA_ORIENTATION=+
MSASYDEDFSGDFDETVESVDMQYGQQQQEDSASVDIPFMHQRLSRKPVPEGHAHLDTTKQMRVWSLMHGGGAVLSAKVNRTAEAFKFLATRRGRRARTSDGAQPEHPENLKAK